MTKLFSLIFQQKLNIFPEIDSEIIDSRKRTQKWTQKWAAVVVSCSDCCFLFRKRAREAASPGASWPADSSSFALGGAPLFEAIFGNLFVHSQLQIWTNMAPKLDPKWGMLEPIWQKQCEHIKVCLDCAGVYGLHMSLSFGTLGATQKSKNESYIFQKHLFCQKCENV